MAARSEAVPPLDPYTCIAKRNRKYSSECTEVYLSNTGAEELSEKFKEFPSLEVVWFNGNRLVRLQHLETNFRIQEVYVQDNRLVSLSGIANLKFLKVLVASNNQLRNLDKQLELLSKFSFLKKLDLSGNPVAEEPDYRLRLIYTIPQVEILDSRVVKGPERLKADEVVPNLDKASPPKPIAAGRKGQQHSVLERDCFKEARQIAQRRRAAEEEASKGKVAVEVEHAHAKEGLLTADKSLNRTIWSQPGKRMQRSLRFPSAYEKNEMRPCIEKHAALEGKDELETADVARLAQVLMEDGLEQVGRTLGLEILAGDEAADAGSPTNVPGGERNALLIQAVRQGNPADVRKALARGADVNARNAEGATSLLVATAEGHETVVSLLLDAKADPRLKTSDNNSAMAVAILRGRSGIMEQLRAQQEATGGAPQEATIHEIREKDYLGNARPARQAHPVDKLAAGETVSAAQVAEWLLSQAWPRMSDARIEKRVQREQEEHGWAALARNHEALEKRIEASRKAVGPLLTELEAARKATNGGVRGAPKDPKEAAGYQGQLDKLEQLPKRIEEAKKELPQDVLTQLLASRAKEVPVAIRLEGFRGNHNEASALGGGGYASTGSLRKHRSDVFHQSYLRPKKEVDEATGRLLLKVVPDRGSTTFGG